MQQILPIYTLLNVLMYEHDVVRGTLSIAYMRLRAHVEQCPQPLLYEKYAKIKI